MDIIRRQCPYCHGQGTISRCSVQPGTGIERLDRCPHCAGSGLITVEVDREPGPGPIFTYREWERSQEP